MENGADESVQNLRRRVMVLGNAASGEIGLTLARIIPIVRRSCAVGTELLINSRSKCGMRNVHCEHTAGTKRLVDAMIHIIQILHIMQYLGRRRILPIQQVGNAPVDVRMGVPLDSFRNHLLTQIDTGDTPYPVVSRIFTVPAVSTAEIKHIPAKSSGNSGSI